MKQRIITIIKEINSTNPISFDHEILEQNRQGWTVKQIVSSSVDYRMYGGEHTVKSYLAISLLLEGEDSPPLKGGDSL